MCLCKSEALWQALVQSWKTKNKGLWGLSTCRSCGTRPAPVSSLHGGPVSSLPAVRSVLYRRRRHKYQTRTTIFVRKPYPHRLLGFFERSLGCLLDGGGRKIRDKMGVSYSVVCSATSKCPSPTSVCAESTIGQARARAILAKAKSPGYAEKLIYETKKF